MTGISGTEGMEEQSGAKEDFIAKVVDAKIDDPEVGQDNDWESDIDLLYEVEPIKVLSKEEKEYDTQAERFIDTSKNIASKWFIFTAHFEKTFGTFKENGIENVEDVLEFMKGKVLKFRDITYTEDDVELSWGPEGNRETKTIEEIFSNQDTEEWGSLLVPYEEVNEEEKADLGVEEGVEDEGGVEEVDF